MLVPVKMHKAEKYAVDMRSLSGDTRSFFMQNFGCARKVYNLYVEFLYGELEKAGYTSGAPLPEMKIPEVTAFKKLFPYLKKADSLGLSNVKIAFEDAVKDYNGKYDHVSYTKRALRREASGTEKLSFRGLKGMPRMHSRKRGDFSYTTNCQYPSESNSLKQDTVRLQGNILYLPKLKEGVRLVVHRPLPYGAVIKNVTVSMGLDNRMYASVNYDYTLQMEMSLREAAISGDTSIIEVLSFLGLDYSQPDFYVDSEGRKPNVPHAYRKSEKKLGRLQKELARMEKGSRNYEKKQREISSLHAKTSNQRKDFVRKEAAWLASTYDVVVVEDINLRAMAGALSLGKNLHDNGFGMFRNILQQKLEQKGSVLVKVDRSFPSTKMCSHCGYVNRDITLDVRVWECPHCHAVHKRDDNAAVNIRNKGKEIFCDYFREWLEKDTAARKKAETLSAARKKKRSA